MSTGQQGAFPAGTQVSVLGSDGQRYPGQVLDFGNGHYLCRFENGSEAWYAAQAVAVEDLPELGEQPGQSAPAFPAPGAGDGAGVLIAGAAVIVLAADGQSYPATVIQLANDQVHCRFSNGAEAWYPTNVVTPGGAESAPGQVNTMPDAQREVQEGWIRWDTEVAYNVGKVSLGELVFTPGRLFFIAHGKKGVGGEVARQVGRQIGRRGGLVGVLAGVVVGNLVGAAMDVKKAKVANEAKVSIEGLSIEQRVQLSPDSFVLDARMITLFKANWSGTQIKCGPKKIGIMKSVPKETKARIGIWWAAHGIQTKGF